ncbi:protein LATERAL BRANCHING OXIDOREDUCTASE 1-like [Pyrus communis]|uniref:protein LATERAL BRANCHING OXIDOREDUCTASE 1-like n=1 Tax=Pyrus communis TaxID=23211 RepID=UPI0035C16244
MSKTTLGPRHHKHAQRKRITDSKNGKWVPVTPILNAFVVNVGDITEIWSNGKYKSIEHRVIANERKARISYASFICPHFDVEIEPLDQMVDTPRMYKKVKYGDYLMTSLSGDYKGRGVPSGDTLK